MRHNVLLLVTADAYRGRVMSLLVIGFNGVTQLGQLQAGAAVALLGPPGAAALGAVAIGMAAMGIAWRRPDLRRFGLDGGPVPAAGRPTGGPDGGK